MCKIPESFPGRTLKSSLNTDFGQPQNSACKKAWRRTMSSYTCYCCRSESYYNYARTHAKQLAPNKGRRRRSLRDFLWLLSQTILVKLSARLSSVRFRLALIENICGTPRVLRACLSPGVHRAVLLCALFSYCTPACFHSRQKVILILTLNMDLRHVTSGRCMRSLAHG